MAAKATKASAAVVAKRWQDMSEAEHQRAIADAQNGNAQALATVLSALPENARLRDLLMDLSGHAREYLIATVYGKNNGLMKRTLNDKAREIERELSAGAEPSALERLLIERIATCWLAAYLADLETENLAQSSTTLTKLAFYEQRRERAHRRYVDSCMALAKVRRLLAPMVAQVNIAQPGAHQLNIAAPRAPEDSPAATVDAVDSDPRE